MEKMKSAEEQLYDGVIFRLNKLVNDIEIQGSEYENIRSTLSSVLTTFKSEFKLGQDNSELLGKLENQLYAMPQSKLNDRKFDDFRTTLGKVETILNHEFE